MFNRRKLFLIINLMFILVLSGCQNSKYPQYSDIQNSRIEYITVENKKFTIGMIKKGIEETFNNVLYNHGNDNTSTYLIYNKELVLKKELKYDLYFKTNSNTGEKAFIFPPQIYLIITNVSHPLSTNEYPKLYKFGIDITKWGLRSDFSFQGHIDLIGKTNFEENANIFFLGRHTMCIDNIVKPKYEQMDKKWENDVKKAICLYMNKNSNKGDNFIPGKYHIYIQGFFKSDKDSVIVFQNENGNIYIGNYYFIHEVQKNKPADLNKIKLLSESDKRYLKYYLENLYSSATLSMEGTIRG